MRLLKVLTKIKTGVLIFIRTKYCETTSKGSWCKVYGSWKKVTEKSITKFLLLTEIGETEAFFVKYVIIKNIKHNIFPFIIARRKYKKVPSVITISN